MKLTLPDQGVSEAIKCFVALGSMVCLASQTFLVPTRTVEWVASEGNALLSSTGEVSVRSLARFRGLVGSTWLSSGVAARLRVREITRVIESRQGRRLCRSWDACVGMSPECRVEILWWASNLARRGSSLIRPRPLDGRMDGYIV